MLAALLAMQPMLGFSLVRRPPAERSEASGYSLTDCRHHRGRRVASEAVTGI